MFTIDITMKTVLKSTILSIRNFTPVLNLCMYSIERGPGGLLIGWEMNWAGREMIPSQSGSGMYIHMLPTVVKYAESLTGIAPNAREAEDCSA